MAIYFDLTRTYLMHEGTPGGISRSVYGLCLAASQMGAHPVVFHSGTRRWHRIFNLPPHSRSRASKKPPLLSAIFRSIGMKFKDPKLSQRLNELRSRGEAVDFENGDALYFVDINMSSLPFYSRSVESLKEKCPGLELVGLVHDIIPLIYPDQCGVSFVKQFKDWINFLGKNCDWIATNSQSVAKEAAAYFADKPIRAIRFGSEVERLPILKPLSTSSLLKILALRKNALMDSYSILMNARSWILSVGKLDRRKNHIFQLEALEPLWLSGELKSPLLIAGRPGSETKRLLKRIQASPILRRYVVLLGPVSDEILWRLYEGAELTIVSSLYEGFGLPVSEALQFGCPCFASCVGGIPEVAGDLIEYFHPAQASELRSLVLRFVSDDGFKKELRSRTEKFKPYSWRDSVKDLVQSRNEELKPSVFIRAEDPIDVVYTWCEENTSDFLSPEGSTIPEGALAQRFRDRGELKYSLRSIEAFMPWVRNVYLLTNGQFPKWLRRDHPRLRWITHQQIYENPDCLPAFNSLSIETNLFRIPGLSEHFLYFNDDFFVGHSLSRDSFFSSAGRPIFFVDRTLLPEAADDLDALVEEDLMKKCHRYNHQLLRSKFEFSLDARNPSHAPQFYSRSLLSKLDETWREEIERTRRSRYREPRNVKIGVLYPYFASLFPEAHRASVLRILTNNSPEYIFKTIRDSDFKNLEDWLDQILKTKPAFFCLNDASEDEAMATSAGVAVQAMLERYFPSRSSFEI